MRIRPQLPARLVTAGALALAGTGAAALPSAALAHSDGGRYPAAGHVYLDDNTAPINTIAGFTRRSDGSLTPLPGSPFTAGGVGTGHGIPSQGAVALAHRGRFLLAVDAGSNQVSVLRVQHGGGLTPVGSPVDSGGTNPVSIAVHRDLVFVANASNTGPNLAAFRLTDDGRLVPRPWADVSLPDGSQPGDVLFNPTGTKLVVALVESSQIASYRVDWRGELTAAPGSPYPAQGLGPFGSAFRPTDPSQLFVSNAHNGAGLGTVSAFQDGFDGRLSPIGASPFANNQTAPCWVTISSDGQYLYAVNTASGSISSYTIADDGTLTLGTNTPVAGTKVGAVDAGLTPDGRVLYLNESAANAVGEFRVDRTALTELPGSPVALPAGARAAGIVVR